MHFVFTLSFFTKRKSETDLKRYIGKYQIYIARTITVFQEEAGLGFVKYGPALSVLLTSAR